MTDEKTINIGAGARVTINIGASAELTISTGAGSTVTVPRPRVHAAASEPPSASDRDIGALGEFMSRTFPELTVGEKVVDAAIRLLKRAKDDAEAQGEVARLRRLYANCDAELALERSKREGVEEHYERRGNILNAACAAAESITGIRPAPVHLPDAIEQCKAALLDAKRRYEADLARIVRDRDELAEANARFGQFRDRVCHALGLFPGSPLGDIVTAAEMALATSGLNAKAAQDLIRQQQAMETEAASLKRGIENARDENAHLRKRLVECEGFKARADLEDLAFDLGLRDYGKLGDGTLVAQLRKNFADRLASRPKPCSAVQLERVADTLGVEHTDKSSGEVADAILAIVSDLRHEAGKVRSMAIERDSAIDGYKDRQRHLDEIFTILSAENSVEAHGSEVPGLRSLIARMKADRDVVAAARDAARLERDEGTQALERLDNANARLRSDLAMANNQCDAAIKDLRRVEDDLAAALAERDQAKTERDRGRETIRCALHALASGPGKYKALALPDALELLLKDHARMSLELGKVRDLALAAGDEALANGPWDSLIATLPHRIQALRLASDELRTMRNALHERLSEIAPAPVAAAIDTMRRRLDDAQAQVLVLTSERDEARREAACIRDSEAVALAAAKLERKILCEQVGLAPDASSDLLLARVTAWSRATAPAAETPTPTIPTGYRRVPPGRLNRCAVGNDHEVFEAESFVEAVQMCRDTLAARAARTPAPTSGKTAP